MYYSYLHQLVPQFNEVIQKHFIANLRAAAENKVPVELKSQFNNIVLEVISWVQNSYVKFYTACF